MACTISLPLEECGFDCSVKARPWSAEGKVEWVGEGIEYGSFRLGAVKFTLHLEQMPKLISLGNTVKVSFDGKDAFIELVHQMH